MSFSCLRSSTSLLCRTRLPQLRSYHSPNHPHAPSYTPIQQKILTTALSLVPRLGFTAESLTEGAKEAGYLEITHNLFPRGPWSLVEYHLVTQREALSSVPLEEKGVGRTIRKLCVERLKGNKDIIGRWQEVWLGSPWTDLGPCGDVITTECWTFSGRTSQIIGWNVVSCWGQVSRFLMVYEKGYIVCGICIIRFPNIQQHWL